MDGHVHDSFITGSIVFGFVILFGFAWHLISFQLADKPIGKAMHILY